MLTKWMNGLWGGKPKVDLVLDSKGEDPYVLSGIFQLSGSWRKQNIKRLECDLVVVERGRKPLLVEPVTTVLMTRTMEAGGYDEYPFRYELPRNLPLLSEGKSYKLQTRLVYENNAKSFDHDEIVVN
ncbi:sporulation protein [Halobacillus sp. SY10]|uniref:Sporulation-control protein n=1 Tax=Halobacillus aidingensis TaxID=240303 RepID=A0A1H0GFF4_HALAD|nr:sporulation protein [Halobacillus aidingensis]SDO05521.1 sporulation-control protein [Halobacillus aidingensis]